MYARASASRASAACRVNPAAVLTARLRFNDCTACALRPSRKKTSPRCVWISAESESLCTLRGVERQRLAQVRHRLRVIPLRFVHDGDVVLPFRDREDVADRVAQIKAAAKRVERGGVVPLRLVALRERVEAPGHPFAIVQRLANGERLARQLQAFRVIAQRP